MLKFAEISAEYAETVGKNDHYLPSIFKHVHV